MRGSPVTADKAVGEGKALQSAQAAGATPYGSPKAQPILRLRHPSTQKILVLLGQGDDVVGHGRVVVTAPSLLV